MTNKSAGFTLLELLIALLITAIIATASALALQQVLKTYRSTTQTQQRLTEIEIAVVLLRRDLEQILNRSIAVQKNVINPGFNGQAQQISFIRGGMIHIPSSSTTFANTTLERVAYLVKNGKLLRQSWRYLDDDVMQNSMQSAVILENIEMIRFFYIDENKQKLKTWPMIYQGTPKLPMGIEAELHLKDWGKVSVWSAVNA